MASITISNVQKSFGKVTVRSCHWHRRKRWRMTAKVSLGIRPEHVTMENDTSTIQAEIELIEPTGFGIILHLRLHGLPFKIFTLDRAALSADQKVWVAFPRSNICISSMNGASGSLCERMHMLFCARDARDGPEGSLFRNVATLADHRAMECNSLG